MLTALTLNCSPFNKVLILNVSEVNRTLLKSEECLLVDLGNYHSRASKGLQHALAVAQVIGVHNKKKKKGVSLIAGLEYGTERWNGNGMISVRNYS